MRSGVGQYVRAPGFRPQLRGDVQFLRGKAVDVIVVYDPQRERRFEMYETECLIAREMNGARTLAEVAAAAKQHVPWATVPQVESLTVQIAGMGLLNNVPETLVARPSAQKMAVARVEGAEHVDASAADFFEGPESWTQLGAEPFDVPAQAPPPTPAYPAPPQHKTVPAPAVWPKPSSAYPSTVQESPPRYAPSVPDNVPDSGPAVEPAPDIEPEPEPIPEEAPVADVSAPHAPAEEAWQVVKPSFYARRKRWIFAGVLALVVGALAIIPYPLYITETCTILPAERAQVRSQIEGLIVEVMVKEGDVVTKGQPLLRLDDRELQWSMQRAQADVDRLEASLHKVRSGNRPEEIRSARAAVDAKAQDVRFASIAAGRVQKLYAQGVASAAARDQAARDLEVARGALSQAEAARKLTESGSRSEEVLIAEAEVAHAKADLEYVKKRMTGLVITSPIAGRVLTPLFQERINSRVAAGDDLCEIGATDHMRVQISVPESDADVIRIGQPVNVKVKSYPLDVFSGTVTFIAPAVVVEEGQRVLRVETRVDNPKDLLRARMTGYSEINAGDRTLLVRMMRRGVRWIRVRFLL